MTARATVTPAAPARQVAVMITRRCNMTCAHCSVESGPKTGADPSEADLVDWIRQSAAANVRAIRLTGGEPMLRAPLVLRLLRECRRLQLDTSLVTNGFWGRTAPQARRHVRALRRAGLDSLTVSYDRYHADFHGPDPLLHISAAAEAEQLPMFVTVVRGADEDGLNALVQRFAGSRHARLRLYDLQPVGRAQALPEASHRADVEGFCTACSFPAITDDGRMIACNGPAYFERAGSPLVVGSVGETPIAALFDRHRAHPILDTIRTYGPAGLAAELRQMPEFAAFPFRPHYGGICELCHQITRDRSAVAALTERLARPELAARRLAAWQVIAGQRRRGTLSAGFLNGIGACRVFLHAATHPGVSFDDDDRHVLASAHLEWRRLADYLGACGLARPLLASLADPELARWAPGFFREALTTRGVSDGLRELVQRETIERTADALRELGGRGVLLKGTALMLRTAAPAIARATSDVDIVVEPALAPRLRELLLARGFSGRPNRGASTFQHLEPIAYRGVPVEIHTRIMAPLWGAPEAELLANAEPVPGSDVLFTPAAEALIFHAAVHTAASFFSHGLKTAWDLTRVVESRSGIDWDTVARWAASSRMPRGFWVPMRLLSRELGLPVPAAFVDRAPHDPGAARVEAIARHRLFRASDTLADLDAITKAGMMLLLCGDWTSRARYVSTKLAWRTSRPDTWSAATTRARRSDLVRQAWRHYRQYRRAVTAAPAPSTELDLS